MSDRTPWEEHLWPVEPLFKGETVFVLASGPSVTQEIADRLQGQKGQRVVVINSTYKLCLWADLWFFTDNNVYSDNRDAVAAFAGHVVTMGRLPKREMPLKVKRVKGNWGPDFIPGWDGVIRQGRSSGHTAISLAIAMGAARIVLLGYDMHLAPDGREHHHNDYEGRPRDLDIYEREFLPAFKGWDADAKRCGVEIINCTPGSALKEFTMRDLDEVLRESLKAAA